MKKYDYITIFSPMVTMLGLQGNTLLVFALIHSFSKDGRHGFQGSFKYIAEWLNVTERSVKEIISNLIKDRYIFKRSEMGENGHPVNVYTTNFEELVERAEAGEVIKPTSIKARREANKNNGEQCSPIVFTGEHERMERVNTDAKKGEHRRNIDNNKDIYKDIILDARAGAREDQEEQESIFYRIFFFKNAADPAAEVRKFIGWNTERGWQTKDGVKFDTTQKRVNLAEYGWECKTGQRLVRCETTEKYYNFLKAVYQLAKDRGGIDPSKILDTTSGYRINSDKVFIIKFSQVVKDWYKSLPYEVGLGLIRKHIGDMAISFENTA